MSGKWRVNCKHPIPAGNKLLVWGIMLSRIYERTFFRRRSEQWIARAAVSVGMIYLLSSDNRSCHAMRFAAHSSPLLFATHYFHSIDHVKRWYATDFSFHLNTLGWFGAITERCGFNERSEIPTENKSFATIAATKGRKFDSINMCTRHILKVCAFRREKLCRSFRVRPRGGGNDEKWPSLRLKLRRLRFSTKCHEFSLLMSRKHLFYFCFLLRPFDNDKRNRNGIVRGVAF